MPTKIGSPKNRLTSTNITSTLLHLPRGEDVDATAKKLLARLEDLEVSRWQVNQELRAVRTALSVAGVRPGDHDTFLDRRENEYYSRQAFVGMTLGEACQRILYDFKERWLSKTQIEYLIERGGYRFSTENRRNSVGVTLQRIAENGKCQVERMRGAKGNRYRWISRFRRLAKSKKPLT